MTRIERSFENYARKSVGCHARKTHRNKAYVTQTDNLYVKLKWRQISCSLFRFHWYRHILARGINCLTIIWSWDLAYLFLMFYIQMEWNFVNLPSIMKKCHTILTALVHILNLCSQCFEITNWSLSSVIFLTITLNRITLYR